MRDPTRIARGLCPRRTANSAQTFPGMALARRASASDYVPWPARTWLVDAPSTAVGCEIRWLRCIQRP